MLLADSKDIDDFCSPLTEKLKNKYSGIENLDNFEMADWTIAVDLRAATGCQSTYALPSLLVEASWSPTLDYEENSQVRHFSDTCIRSRDPVWNQRLSLEGPLAEDEKLGGSIWINVYD